MDFCSDLVLFVLGRTYRHWVDALLQGGLVLGYADDVPPLFLFFPLSILCSRSSKCSVNTFEDLLPPNFYFFFLFVHFARSSFTSVNMFDGLLRRTSMPSDPRLGIQEPSPRITVLFIYLYLTIFCI